MPLQGLYTDRDQDQDQPGPGGLLLAGYTQGLPLGRGAPVSGVGPVDSGALGAPGDLLMAQLAPPRGVVAPALPGPAGAPGGGGADQSLAEQLRDPDVQEMLGLKPPSGPGAAPPQGRDAHMLGAVPVIDAVPPGIGPRYDPSDVDRQLQALSFLGKPIPPNLTAAKSMFDQGIVVGTDNKPYRVKMGGADPERISQTRGAEAAPELAQHASDTYAALVTTPAEGARKDADTATQLRKTLSNLPTSGPATQLFGRVSDVAAQLGIDPGLIKSFGLPGPGEVTMADKGSNTLLTEIARTAFPQRITDRDIRLAGSMIPQAANRKEANEFIITNMIMPSIEREQARADALRGQKFATSQEVHSAVDEWNAKHPIDEFRPKPPAAPGTAPGAAPGLAPGAAAPPGVTRWVPNPRGGFVPGPPAAQ